MGFFDFFRKKGNGKGADDKNEPKELFEIDEAATKEALERLARISSKQTQNKQEQGSDKSSGQKSLVTTSKNESSQVVNIENVKSSISRINCENIKKQSPKTNYEGLVVQGDLLKRVNPHNVIDGVFVVPNYVKSIDVCAFYRLDNLKTIVFHEDMRYIAPRGIYKCENLETVVGLENAKIKSMSFYECKNLKIMSSPKGLVFLTDDAFNGCQKLQSITIPDGCMNISRRAFAGCESLKYIQIPPSVELVQSGAFAGCENLVVEIIDETEKIDLFEHGEELGINVLDFFVSEEELDDEDALWTNEAINNENILPIDDTEMEETQQEVEIVEQLIDEMGINAKVLDIAGRKVFWPIGKIMIQPEAFSGVKEVITHSQETMQKVIKSGYKGKLTLVDKESGQEFSVDYKSIQDFQKKKIKETREKYYNQFLIPKGGITNWHELCKKFNYRCSGYSKDIVCIIPISKDCRIEVVDHTQPKGSTSGYDSEREEFFTSVSFYKKELDDYSVYAPYEYDRGNSVYYPYGARFNKQILKEIGEALSMLIDNAREMEDTLQNQERLKLIKSKQKSILSLLTNGTNDTKAVEKIMQGVNLIKYPCKVRPARGRNDWLPKPPYSDKQGLKDDNLIK